MYSDYQKAYQIVNSNPDMHREVSRLSDEEKRILIESLNKVEKCNKDILHNAGLFIEKNSDHGCMIPGCDKQTVKCHLMQRKRTLVDLIKNKNVNYEFYRIKLENIYKYDPTKGQDSRMYKSKIHISEALTSKIYCGYHDNNFFKEIEKSPPNFLDYRCQLMHAYKAVCTELRNKLNVKDFFEIVNEENIKLRNCMYKEVTLPVQKIIDKYYFNHPMFGINSKMEGWDEIVGKLQSIKNKMEDELISLSQNRQFSFKVNVIDQIPAATNCITSSEQGYDSFLQKPPYFFMIIPYQGKSYLIMGCDESDKDEWIDKTMSIWDKYNEQNIQIVASTQLLLRCTTWVITRDFYNSLDQRFKNYIAVSHSPKLNQIILECGEINLFKQYHLKRIVV